MDQDDSILEKSEAPHTINLKKGKTCIKTHEKLIYTVTSRNIVLVILFQ